MKHILWSAATAALLFASCAKDGAEVLPAPEASGDFTATVAADSRTVLDGTSVKWETADEISVFTKTAHNRQYGIKSITDNTATFSYKGYTGSDATAITANYAVYPYNAAATISGDVITTTLPAAQAYDATKVSLANSLMVAKSDDQAFAFKNAAALLRFNVAKENVPDAYTLKTITLTTSTKKIAGEVTIDTGSDNKAVVTENGATEVVYSLGEGVEVTTTAQSFYVVLAATEFAADELTVKFTFADNSEKSVALPAFTLAQNSIKTINYTIKADDFTGTTEDMAEVLEVSTPEELAAALTADETNISIVLANDIAVPITSLGEQTSGSGEYRLGGENTETIGIDLNGHKLTITTTYMSAIGANNADALFTIKNGTMTSSTTSGTWNIYDLTFANCNYVLENVVFDKAVAFCNDNKEVSIKNVTINETHDYYAMWVSATGQKLTVDNLTINSTAGRGIKIDDEYVNEAVAKVTLNVSNSTFKTAKKAAVLVKTSKGATITWGEGNSIAEVAADPYNAVWCDEDAADYYDLIAVTGANCILEGTMAIVSSQADLTTALGNSKVAQIVLNPGEYDLGGASIAASNLTIKGADKEKSIVKFSKSLYTNNSITLENLTVNVPTGLTYNEFDFAYVHHAANFNLKNCASNGRIRLNVKNANISDCTFTMDVSSGFDGYAIFYYGSTGSKVVVENSTFNTAGKAIVMYTESAKTFDLTVNKCSFVSSNTDTDKAAIQMHTEHGISGTLTITESTATGFADINGGMWNELNNSTATATDNFDITIDGTKVH